MKRLLLPLFVLLSISAHAQWSAGIRTGAGFWNVTTVNSETYSYEDVNQTLWQNLVYVRYELCDMLALEAGFSRISAASQGQYVGLCGVGLPADYEFVSDTKFREQIYSLEIRGLLRSPYLRWGRLSNEIGFVLAPGISRVEKIGNIQHFMPVGYEQYDRSTVDSRSCMQFGFEDQVHYLIGKHFDLNVAAGFRYVNGARFVNNGVTLQAGFGYRF